MAKAKFLSGANSNGNNADSNVDQSTQLTTFIDEAFTIVEDDFSNRMQERQDALTDKIVETTYQAANLALGNARARLDREGFVEKFRAKLRAFSTVYGASSDDTASEQISESDAIAQLPSSN